MTKITGKKRPREKNPTATRRKKKTRRDIAEIKKQMAGLESRIEQLEAK